MNMKKAIAILAVVTALCATVPTVSTYAVEQAENSYADTLVGDVVIDGNYRLSSVSLNVGESIECPDGSWIDEKSEDGFTSDDPSIASVTTDGYITAVSAGTTDIYFISYAKYDESSTEGNYIEGEIIHKCTVTVTDPESATVPTGPLTTLYVSDGDNILEVGERATVIYNADANLDGLKYTVTGDTDAATVFMGDDYVEGIIALKPGVFTITATTDTGSASVTITVVDSTATAVSTAVATATSAAGGSVSSASATTGGSPKTGDNGIGVIGGIGVASVLLSGLMIWKKRR